MPDDTEAGDDLIELLAEGLGIGIDLADQLEDLRERLSDFWDSLW